MLYRGKFSDYNNKLYTLDFETSTESTTKTETIEIFNESYNTDNRYDFEYYQDSVNQGTGFNASGIYSRFNSNIPYCIPSNFINFVLNTLYMSDYVSDGDDIEFTFDCFMAQSFDFSNRNNIYGVKFGKMIFDQDYTAKITDGIDVNVSGVRTYSYRLNIDSGGGMFGFVMDNPTCYQFAFKNMKITNHTNNKSMNIQSGNTWKLSSYYTIPTLGTLNCSLDNITKCTMQNGDEKILYNNLKPLNGQSFNAWDVNTYIGLSTPRGNYNPDTLSEGNKTYPYPNVWWKKKIELPRGKYHLTLNNVESKNGEGIDIKFKHNNGVRFETRIPKGLHTILEYDIEIGDDCDELFIGNDTFDRFNNQFTLNSMILTSEAITDTENSITLGSDPFVVELEGDEEDIFKPIKCTTATARIVSDKYLFDLYSNKNDIHVKLYEGDKPFSENIKWIGIVKPLIFNMGYNQELEEIDIECVDYISILDDISLDNIYILENKPLMSFGELFNLIIRNNTRYKYINYPEIFDFNMLSEYKVSTANFIDENCKIVDDTVIYAEKNWSLYKILDEMCRYMGVTMVADGEELYLIPYLHLQYNLTYTRYSVEDILAEPQTEYKPVEDNSFNVDNIYDNSDLELLPVLNKFIVKTKTNKVDILLPDFLNDDNLVNITYNDGNKIEYDTKQSLPTMYLNDMAVDGECKFYRCKSNKVKSNKYIQIEPPSSQSTIDGTNIATIPNYANSYWDLVGNYSCGIMDYRYRDLFNTSNGSEFKSSTSNRFSRYLVLSKGTDLNLQLMSMSYPLFVLESDDMQFTNKMALCITGSLINTPYRRGSNRSDIITEIYDRVPVDTDFDATKFDFQATNNSTAYEHTNLFCNLVMQIQIGQYYFHNVGSYFNSEGVLTSINHFFREGWWNRNWTGGGVQGTRLQFDNEANTYPFYRTMSVTDNSGDWNINQESGGYWIKLNANDYQGTPRNDQLFGVEEHLTLPEHFTGKLKISFYPNPSQTIDDHDRYFGDMVQFLRDFKVKLIVPRDMNYTEDEWKSETEITAIVDNESLQKTKEITCELHTDFGKCPSYSNVIGARNYTIKNISEDAHGAEEWIVFNNTKQYSEIRKILNTSLKEDVRPYSVIKMKGRKHFEKLIIDSYSKNYRTGLTEVKLIEIADL